MPMRFPPTLVPFVVVCFVALAASAAPAAVQAQEPAAEEARSGAPPEGPAAAPGAAREARGEPTPPAGFERVAGPAAAQAPVEAPPLVIAAYLFIWGVILAYLVVLWQRQRRLDAELEGLARRLRRAVE